MGLSIWCLANVSAHVSAIAGQRAVGDALCNILKFCRYAYSVFALNLTLDMGTS